MSNIDNIRTGLERGWKEMKEVNFRNFRFNLFFRVTLLTVTIFIFVLMLSKAGYGVTAFGLWFLIIFQVIKLIKQVEDTNREVINFLNSVRYDDFSNSYLLSNTGKTFEDLNDAFRNVLVRFKQIRNEKESRYQYLKSVVRQAGFGLICFDAEGKIKLINGAAKRTLKLAGPEHIDELAAYSPELVRKLRTLSPGSSDLVKVVRGAETDSLNLSASELTLHGKEYKLISFQNIRSRLEEQEMEAWQKIIRVLTHEIMNSMAPISSLANTVESEIDYLLENWGEEELQKSEVEDLFLAVQTIQRRSESLVRFVNDFRNLTQISEPVFKNIRVSEMYESVVRLLKLNITQNDILLKIKVEPDNLIITADSDLIEQVLINLVKNAVDALSETEGDKERQIVLRARIDDKSRPVLEVCDNGPGIDSEALERIFVPFFSTKKFSSGIGLSLARQIMRLHNGSIAAESSPENGSRFVLKF